MDKRQSEQAHFLNRMQFRCLGVSYVDMISFNQQIQAGESTAIRKLSNRVTSHGIFYKGSWIVVLYDRERKQVVTILPKEDKLYKALIKKIKENGRALKKQAKKLNKTNYYESSYEQRAKEQYPVKDPDCPEDT